MDISQKAYCVEKYSIDNLRELFQACTPEITNELIDEKLQQSYFKNYFDFLDAKTIILEKDYVDKDYLEDFSHYYVRCFNQYKRFCNRLHFFTKEFDESFFTELLSGEIKDLEGTIKDLNDSYLGFIVVKPLPATFIGKTCLKTYPAEKTRNFPVLREYHSNLFGIPLSVKSLAFQEQDSVVAACATSALWSAFHGTGKLFQHPILSPVEITKIATKESHWKERFFPNHGLSLELMANAIRTVGLEPQYINPQNSELLKANIYAYLKAKIPILLAFKLYDLNKKQFEDVGHVAAIAGYNLSNNSIVPFGDCELLLKSSQVNKIYAHDDQVGPFAKMEFITSKDNSSLLTTSYGRTNDQDNYEASPIAIIVPLYHKIRIPFTNILGQIYELYDFLKFSFQFDDNEFPPFLKFEWDIYLSNVNELKTNLLKSENLEPEYRKCLLTRNYPRYVWCTTASIEGEKIFNLIFDATDIEQNLYLIDIIEHNKDISELLIKLCRKIYDKFPFAAKNLVIRKFSEESFKC